jgi:cytochrome c oxidase cbb3-type subunit 2
MRNPRAVVPSSIMPGYPFLEKTPLDARSIAARMSVLAIEGVPYTPEMIEKAQDDLVAQGSVDADPSALQKRYPRAITRDARADKGELTEFDALVAYLQQLGTHVDFKIYNDKANIR